MQAVFSTHFVAEDSLWKAAWDLVLALEKETFSGRTVEVCDFNVQKSSDSCITLDC